ncbi:acetylxylan esterase [Ilyomonas limi]|uniref:Acetylxylan esterase n=1 Tax=Ilyomonas limi TaxID=2575867 RepID=A0A4U3KVD3_9BACT|nr:DUF4974 domain-containing protein [Ilyomonas limi]TKK65799.1 acetylxylan esterase [Ilyomonas limi]
MNKHFFILILFLCAIATNSFAQQNSDEQYKKPLSEVLKQVEKRFNISIRYPDSLVTGKTLTYADWRYRTDVDETLSNMLTPLDLVAAKTDPGKYKIKAYEYYRTSVVDGKEKLDYLSAQYHDQQSWELRKDSLRSCMYKALQLSPLPPKPASQPIITNKRKMDGYTIENIGFEVLPGVYICGSLYKPAVIKGKIPVVLSPDGHFGGHRYRPDCQRRCAMLAKMGCMAIDYDLFAWNESLLQFNEADHRRPLAMAVQALGSIRILDYMLSLKDADTNRVAISGASGGGSQTMLITALDDRIKLSAPVVMLSCYMYGGCPCETGMPIHLCGGGTNNPEIAAMAAPRPQLIVSDGGDWTDHVPQIEFPYLKKMYSYYGAANNVENVHLAGEGHDYGPSKRQALYHFIARHFNLDSTHLLDAAGNFNEHGITVEKTDAMLVFGKDGKDLPATAIHGYDQLEAIFNNLKKNQ